MIQQTDFDVDLGKTPQERAIEDEKRRYFSFYEPQNQPDISTANIARLSPVEGINRVGNILQRAFEDISVSRMTSNKIYRYENRSHCKANSVSLDGLTEKSCPER